MELRKQEQSKGARIVEREKVRYYEILQWLETLKCVPGGEESLPQRFSKKRDGFQGWLKFTIFKRLKGEAYDCLRECHRKFF